MPGKKNNLLVIILSAVGVLILFGVIARKNKWIGDDDTVKVSAEKAELRTITETVSANGKVQPEVEVKISPDVSGEIVELGVIEGQAVKKGDLLARINPDIYHSIVERMNASLNSTRASLANARARLSQAEAQFLKTEADYKRNKKLFDDGAVSQAEFDAINSAYQVAKAEVEGARQSVLGAEFNVKSTEASLKEASDNLNKTSIYAPVNGTISKLNVEQGERVVGTSQMAGTEMMRIANLNEMEVNVEVNENDIVRVHLSDTALISVDAYLDRKFKGIVTEIANSANLLGVSTDQVTNFNVKIRILRESYADLIPKDKPHLSPFRPGMSAAVDIQTKTAGNVIAVPIQAVTTRDTTVMNRMKRKEKESSGREGQNGKTENKKDEKGAEITECVFVIKEDKAVMKTVKTGIQDHTYIEIIGGVNRGDEVVTGPYTAISKNLKNGTPVKVVPRDQLFEDEGRK